MRTHQKSIVFIADKLTSQHKSTSSSSYAHLNLQFFWSRNGSANTWRAEQCRRYSILNEPSKYNHRQWVFSKSLSEYAIKLLTHKKRKISSLECLLYLNGIVAYRMQTHKLLKCEWMVAMEAHWMSWRLGKTFIHMLTKMCLRSLHHLASRPQFVCTHSIKKASEQIYSFLKCNSVRAARDVHKRGADKSLWMVQKNTQPLNTKGINNNRNENNNKTPASVHQRRTHKNTNKC